MSKYHVTLVQIIDLTANIAAAAAWDGMSRSYHQRRLEDIRPLEILDFEVGVADPVDPVVQYPRLNRIDFRRKSLGLADHQSESEEID